MVVEHEVAGLQPAMGFEGVGLHAKHPAGREAAPAQEAEQDEASVEADALRRNPGQQVLEGLRGGGDRALLCGLYHPPNGRAQIATRQVAEAGQHGAAIGRAQPNLRRVAEVTLRGRSGHPWRPFARLRRADRQEALGQVQVANLQG